MNPSQTPSPVPAASDFSGQPEARGHRLIIVSLTLASLVIAWLYMAAISRTDPWYRNTDMNAHSMVDALAINSDLSPKLFAQPAIPLKYLLALDYRVRHYLGLLPVWNMKKFGASADPLSEIPPLIRIERVHSRILVMLFILSAAGLTYAITRCLDSTCLTVVLLCGSSGLLFHGLLIRPELLCAGFGNILALLCTWQATAGRSWIKTHAWLLLAGFFIGLATLEKLPGIFYVLPCYAWCWLSGLIALAERSETVTVPDRLGFLSGLLPAAIAVSLLWLLLQFGPYHELLGPVAVQRLRTAAVLIGVLPLLLLWPGRSRVWLFLCERMRELVLIAAGGLAALVFSYLLLRGVMSESSAATYLAHQFHFVINPAPHMSLLVTGQNVGGQFLLFFKESPMLFSSTAALAIGVCLLRSFPLRLKALIVLLVACALGLTLLMSKRYYFAAYSIFPQVPFLLAWSLGLAGFKIWWQRRYPMESVHWMAPVAFTAACVLMLIVYLQLRPKYYFFQDDVTLPVKEFTLTYLFDHDNHIDAYPKIMAAHYGTREQFAATLARYLADPSNRH